MVRSILLFQMSIQYDVAHNRMKWKTIKIKWKFEKRREKKNATETKHIELKLKNASGWMSIHFGCILWHIDISVAVILASYALVYLCTEACANSSLTFAYGPDLSLFMCVSIFQISNITA